MKPNRPSVPMQAVAFGIHHVAVGLETRSHLKNFFWPPAFFGGIGAVFQILDIQQYACGLKLGPAAILVGLGRIEPKSYF